MRRVRLVSLRLLVEVREPDSFGSDDQRCAIARCDRCMRPIQAKLTRIVMDGEISGFRCRTPSAAASAPATCGALRLSGQIFGGIKFLCPEVRRPFQRYAGQGGPDSLQIGLSIRRLRRRIRFRLSCSADRHGDDQSQRQKTDQNNIPLTHIEVSLAATCLPACEDVRKSLLRQTPGTCTP